MEVGQSCTEIKGSFGLLDLWLSVRPFAEKKGLCSTEEVALEGGNGMEGWREISDKDVKRSEYELIYVVVADGADSEFVVN